MTSKLSYTEIVASNLLRHQIMPGDIVSLAIRNDGGREGIYKQAKRTCDAFLSSFAFWPTEIVLHPDHLDILRKQGRTIDIILSDQEAALMGLVIANLADLPTRIPLVGDDTLDFFTTVARYVYREEMVEEMVKAMFKAALGMIIGTGGVIVVLLVNHDQESERRDGLVNHDRERENAGAAGCGVY